MEHEQEIEITIGEPIAAKVLDTCVGTVILLLNS